MPSKPPSATTIRLDRESDQAGRRAFGIRAAYGMQAYAQDFAGFPLRLKRSAAYALHVNDSAARDFFDHSRFFSWTRIGRQEFEHFMIGFLCVGLIFGIAEICWKSWRIRRGSR